MPGVQEPARRASAFVAAESLNLLSDLDDEGRDYLDMVLHTFPSQLSPATEFAARQPSQRELPGLYSSEIDDLVAAGASRAEAECGMAEIAGISVAASFVGGVAGALVVADVLRSLHGGREIAILQLDLRTPNELAVVDNRAADGANPGFVRLCR